MIRYGYAGRRCGDFGQRLGRGNVAQWNHPEAGMRVTRRLNNDVTIGVGDGEHLVLDDDGAAGC
jgi:hypothetical protein